MILIFLKLLSYDIDNFSYNHLVNILIVSTLIFVVFNFWPKFSWRWWYLWLKFFIGFILIECAILSEKISPTLLPIYYGTYV